MNGVQAEERKVRIDSADQWLVTALRPCKLSSIIISSIPGLPEFQARCVDRVPRCASSSPPLLYFPILNFKNSIQLVFFFSNIIVRFFSLLIIVRFFFSQNCSNIYLFFLIKKLVLCPKLS